MRAVVLPLLATLCWASFGDPARAATLPFSGVLRIQISTLEPLAIGGSGVAVVEGSSGEITQLQLASAAFSTAGLLLPITDPAASPILGLQATLANAAGSFTRAAGSADGFGGRMALLGISKVCLFAFCDQRPPANVTVPLSVVGTGGAAKATFLVNVTIGGAAWTTGLVAIPTAMGAHVFTRGGISPTSAGGLAVRLVTPAFVSTNIGALRIVPAFASLDLRLVPEPATAVLLGLGIAGLVGRARARPARTRGPS